MCVSNPKEIWRKGSNGGNKKMKPISHFAFLKENWAFHNQFAKKVSAVTAITIVYNPLQNAPS